MFSPPAAREKQQKARRVVAKAFYAQYGKDNALRDPDGKAYGFRNGQPIKKVRKLTENEQEAQIKGINFEQPVILGPKPSCDSRLHQWQPPGNDRGNYFAQAGTQPTELGIRPIGKAWSQPGRPVVQKEQTEHQIESSAPYLRSTSAPANDNWSVPKDDPSVLEHEYQTLGGGEQTYIPSGCDPNSPLVR